MIKKYSNLFWGILLIAAGGVALAQTQGYLNDIKPTIWMIVFAGISILSLVFYFLSGVQNWGMLFPAGIFGALAILLALAVNDIDDPAMAAPLFVGIGAPFVVAFLLNRQKNWWALIPTGVMAFLAFVLLVVDKVPGEVIGSGLFFILAAAFGAVYAIRRAMWAAIVAYVMFVLGFTPLIAMSARPELVGIVIMLAVALPFFVIYFNNPEQRWWTIMPAGITATTGLIIALVLLTGWEQSIMMDRIANAVMYLGIAATFAVVWLRHQKRWGLFFALLSVAMAVISGLVGDVERSWPLLLVLAGIALLVNAIRSKTA